MKRVMILIVILLITACEKDKSPTQSALSNMGTIQVVIDKISGTKTSAADLLDGDTIKKPALVNRVELRVLAKDNSQIASTVLVLTNGNYEGTVTVEAQNDLKVLCIGTNNGIIEYCGIDDDVDVQPGKTATAVITGWNASYIPTITDSPTHSIDGTYTLIWTEAPSGTEYVLEEANNQLFAAAQTVYSGSTRQFQVSDKEDGTYYYRVQAKNPYNIISGWSAVFTVTVDSSLKQFVISGTISGADEVVVTLSGDASGTKTVNDGGSYSFTVAEGGNYTVTPSKAGYTFSPISMTFTNVADDKTQNYVANDTVSGKIIFVSDRDGTRELYSMDYDGSNQTRITNNNIDEYYPRLSPDGSKIVFHTRSDENFNLDVYIVNADGTSLQRLTTTTTCQQPSWSPDGTQIVYVSDSNKGILSIMHWDGTNKTKLDFINEGAEGEGAWRPTWSPDGTQLAFTYLTNSGTKMNIHKINLDQSNHMILTYGNNDHTPSFSPDGNQIVYCSNDDIFLMNSDGSKKQQLTINTDYDGNPLFLPDGSHIIFQSNRDGNFEIYIMDKDDSNLQNLTNNQAVDKLY